MSRHYDITNRDINIHILFHNAIYGVLLFDTTKQYYRATINAMRLSRRKLSAYERVPLAELKQGRRGKHRQLVDEIVTELCSLADAEAMRIPLDSVDGISLANLRSAVARGMKSRGVKIATFSDGSSLYVWRKTAGTSRYERKRRPRRT